MTLRATGENAERGGVALISMTLAIAFFAPAIFVDQIPIYRDFVNVFLPFRIYAARTLREGRLPLWTPETAFGVPFAANYQSAIYYPLSAIFDLFPTPRGMGLYLAVHFFIAAIGMDQLLRDRGLSERARLGAAIIMMLGGVMISATAGNHLSVLSWIPLSLAAAERFVREPRRARFAWLVALLTVQVLAGAPETFAQSAALVAASAWTSTRRLGKGWAPMLLVGVAGIAALTISAVQLIPTAEYFAQTRRASGLSAGPALDNSLEPKTLSTLWSPHRLDSGIVTQIEEDEVPIFWSIYIGRVPLALLVLGIATRGARRWVLVLAGSLILALGRYTPVYPALYGVAPWLFGAFRYPQKFLFTAHVAAAVIVAMGFNWLERLSKQLREPIPRLLGVALVVMTLVDLWTVHEPAMLFWDWNDLLSSPPAELIQQGSDARIFQYEVSDQGLEPWLPHFWIGGNLRAREREIWSNLGMNVPLAYDIGFANGFDSMSELRPSIEALNLVLRGLPLTSAVQLLRGLGVRFLIGEQQLDDPELEILQRGRPGSGWVYRINGVPSRIRLARAFQTVNPPRNAFLMIADSSFDPARDVVLHEPLQGKQRGDIGRGALRILQDAAESLTVETESAEPTLLVVADSFFPGWRAEIDGTTVPIHPANAGLARAIAVPSGKHVIRMDYRPNSFRLGLLISLTSLFAFSMLLRRFPSV